ncbi:E3 ubiquitin-protein ligase Os04g0590900-like [Syzygium oleosum]|uniref:E3 ubiquitin-protein ligase Os04g0590900-like n=1 Tax=Syzygium oleosum TaxID=219896 RepID=UPI0024BAD442|nr:E3 ubiquitin-protein ligase Os04g0590900-like [Syzygium oleosum]
MGPRKLLLSAEPPAANVTSSTCLSWCDPSCSTGCPEYSSPPPPAAPYWPPSYVPSDANDGSGSARFPPAVIVVIGILGGVFLLVSYYFIIAKCCLHRRRRRRSRSRDQPASDGGGGGGGGGEEVVDEDRVDHPIWYIRTVGLSPAAISAIAMCEYRKGEGLVEGSDCTVCLSEFSDGETLRVLPKCGHAFHVPCIDTWLRSHTNCPLCRAPIVGPIPLPLPLPPPERLSQRLDGGGDGNRAAAGAVVGGGENSNGAGAGAGGVESGESNSDGLSKEIDEVNGRDGQLGLVEEEEEGVVPVRRSVSMDSPFLVIELRQVSESQSSDANTSEPRTTHDSQSSADRANTSSHPRSLSWSGRLFTPRHNNNSNSRNSSNSTLPR